MALRWAVYAALRRTTRDDARRGAIYDARCRNGTTRPWHCVGRCTRWCRQIAILRRSSGRHKCRPYDAGCSSAELRRSSGRHKCHPYVAGCSPAALRRSSGRHKCHPTLRGVRPRHCGCHPGDTSVAPTLRGARSRHCGRPWLSTVDDFYDGDGLDKLTFRYVTVRSNLDGAFSIRYVDVLTVIIRGRFIGQQKYNCPDRRHDHS